MNLLSMLFTSFQRDVIQFSWLFLTLPELDPHRNMMASMFTDITSFVEAELKELKSEIFHHKRKMAELDALVGDLETLEEESE